MASSYSILRNYGEVQPAYDFNLLQKGLEIKQGQYDANSIKLQEFMSGIQSIDLAKNQDKQYLMDRMSSITDEINSFGSQDLSNQGVFKNIQNFTSGAVDEKVIAAAQGTQNYRNLVSNIQDIRDNSPEKYSDINAAYALRGAQEWLNDDQTGTTYAGGRYTDYVDVRGKYQAILKDMYKDSESSIQYKEMDANGQPTGRLVTKKFKGLDDETLSQIFEQNLEPQDVQQMQINSWFTASNNPQGVSDTFNAYKDVRLAELESYKSKSTGKTKEKFTRRIEELNDLFSQIEGSPEAMANFVEKESTLAALKTQFKKRQIGLKYEKDAVFFEKATGVINQPNPNIPTSPIFNSSSTSMSEVAVPDPNDDVDNATQNSNQVSQNIAETLVMGRGALEKLGVSETDLQEEIEIVRDLYPNYDKEAIEMIAINSTLNELEDLTPDQEKARLDYSQTVDKTKSDIEFNHSKWDEVKTNLKKDYQILSKEIINNPDFRQAADKYWAASGFGGVAPSDYESMTPSQKEYMTRVAMVDAILESDTDNLTRLETVKLLASSFGESSREVVIETTPEKLNSDTTKLRYFKKNLGYGKILATEVYFGDKTQEFVSSLGDITDKYSIGDDSIDDMSAGAGSSTTASQILSGSSYKRHVENAFKGLKESTTENIINITGEVIKGEKKISKEQEVLNDFISAELGKFGNDRDDDINKSLKEAITISDLLKLNKDDVFQVDFTPNTLGKEDARGLAVIRKNGQDIFVDSNRLLELVDSGIVKIDASTIGGSNLSRTQPFKSKKTYTYKDTSVLNKKKRFIDNELVNFVNSTGDINFFPFITGENGQGVGYPVSPNLVARNLEKTFRNTEYLTESKSKSIISLLNNLPNIENMEVETSIDEEGRGAITLLNDGESVYSAYMEMGYNYSTQKEGVDKIKALNRLNEATNTLPLLYKILEDMVVNNSDSEFIEILSKLK